MSIENGQARGPDRHFLTRQRVGNIQNAAPAVVALGFDLMIWVDAESQIHGHVPASVVVAAVLVYATLLARRTHPLAVFFLLLAFGLMKLVDPTVVPFAGPLLALHSVASRCALRVAAPCLVISAAPIAIHAWAVAAARGRALTSTWMTFAAQFMLLNCFVAAAWGVGRLAHAADRRQKVRSQAAASAALRAERLRIAGELHDSVSHAVTAMLLHAAGARQSPKFAEDPDLVGALAVIESSGTQAMAEMHQLLKLLRTPTDDVSNAGALHPGIRAVDQLVHNARLSGLVVQVEARGTPEFIDPSVSLAAYRVVQEALTNVVKHAGLSARVRLLLDWRPDELVVEVHNATPADHRPCDAGLNSGFGIPGLRERLRVIGGHLDSSHDATGFLLRARLPCGSGPVRQNIPTTGVVQRLT